MYRNAIVLGFAIVLAAGCSNMNTHKNHATTQPAAKANCETTTCESAAPAPAVATSNLAGQWQLAIPRQGIVKATITATDDTHVTIDAGNLSGKYVVQGQYLLILSRDTKMQPLAWKITSSDSLTVVRSCEGEDATGSTLVRAASDWTAATEWSEDASGH